MKIAICDDNPHELAKISSFIAAYREENDVLLTYQTFLSGTELVSTMTSGDYDILFLDILMPVQAEWRLPMKYVDSMGWRKLFFLPHPRSSRWKR